MNNDLTLITCSYNTLKITATMLRSFYYHHPAFDGKLLVMENSSDHSTEVFLKENNIPYIRTPGLSHAEGVNLSLKHCPTRYALLVDTDIIFLKNITDIFNQFKHNEFTAAGNVSGDRGGKRIHKRIDPWFCFLDVQTLRQYNIEFCNIRKTQESFTSEVIYDIGSTMLEELRNSSLRIGNIDLNNRYFIHLEGMSWYKNKYDPSKPDTGIDFGGTHNNKNLYDSYFLKEAHFLQHHDFFKPINLKNVFK